MRIVAKSVRSLDRHLPGVAQGTALLPALTELEDHERALERVGLGWPVREGDSVLPRALGPRSKFNAEGGETIHRDQPREQVWHLVWTRWLEWHGREQREEWGTRARSYSRFPRTPISPPEVELKVAKDAQGELVVVTAPLRFGVDDPDALLHHVNLLLELFGQCELLTEDLGPLLGPPERRLNWGLLPRGRRPWPQLREDLRLVVQDLPDGDRQVAEYRLRLMNSFGPDFFALGRAGFTGYVVFGFEDRGRYVLESLFTGNATYIFGDDWERLSGLTKAQIIQGDLAEERIVHNRSFERRLRGAIEA
jgi:hypothetical protein